MKNKKQHGGKRKGSGRKAVDDKKIPLTIYVKESVVNKIGKGSARELAQSPFIGRDADEVWKELLQRSHPITGEEAKKRMEDAVKAAPSATP